MDAPGNGIELMSAYLLDTNHVGLAVDRASIVGQRIVEARLAGIRLGTCLPVLCEIEAGLQQVRRKAKYRLDLNHLLLQIRLWPIDLKTAQIYGNIYTELRRSGRVLSQADGDLRMGLAEIIQRCRQIHPSPRHQGAQRDRPHQLIAVFFC